MIAINFPQANRGQDDIGDLDDIHHITIPSYLGPIHQTESGYNYLGTITCWKLSKEDLEEIQKTGVVWVTMEMDTGAGTAVSLGLESPFK